MWAGNNKSRFCFLCLCLRRKVPGLSDEKIHKANRKRWERKSSNMWFVAVIGFTSLNWTNNCSVGDQFSFRDREHCSELDKIDGVHIWMGFKLVPAEVKPFSKGSQLVSSLSNLEPAYVNRSRWVSNIWIYANSRFSLSVKAAWSKTKLTICCYPTIIAILVQFDLPSSIFQQLHINSLSLFLVQQMPVRTSAEIFNTSLPAATAL